MGRVSAAFFLATEIFYRHPQFVVSAIVLVQVQGEECPGMGRVSAVVYLVAAMFPRHPQLVVTAVVLCLALIQVQVGPEDRQPCVVQVGPEDHPRLPGWSF